MSSTHGVLWGHVPLLFLREVTLSVSATSCPWLCSGPARSQLPAGPEHLLGTFCAPRALGVSPCQVATARRLPAAGPFLPPRPSENSLADRRVCQLLLLVTADGEVTWVSVSRLFHGLAWI